MTEEQTQEHSQTSQQVPEETSQETSLEQSSEQSPTPDVQAQMAQMATAIQTIAQSQSQLNETAQSIMKAQQPQQRYLNQVEQGTQTQQPTSYDDMTQGEMAQAILGQVSNAIAASGSQLGDMVRTINSDWPGFQPGMREGMQGMMGQGLSFNEAYTKMTKLSAAQKQAEPEGTSQEDIDSKVAAGVKAVLQKRRAFNAGAAGKPGRSDSGEATLTPAERFDRDFDTIADGGELDKEFTRGL